MSILEITTAIGCPINCQYCPQDKLLLNYHSAIRSLSFQNFQTCLSTVPNSVVVNFAGFCEPWRNPECSSMILHAFSRNHPVALYTTLQGTTHEDWDLVEDHEFSCLNIHIPDAEGLCHFRITMKYLSVLERVLAYPKVQVNCHGHVHPKVQHLIKSCPAFGLQDRAGNVNIPAVQKPYKNGPIYCHSCSMNFDQNVLLPDGTVVLCCQDWAIRHPLGNLLTQSWTMIRGGSPIAAVRLACRNDLPVLCRSCSGSRSSMG